MTTTSARGSGSLALKIHSAKYGTRRQPSAPYVSDLSIDSGGISRVGGVTHKSQNVSGSPKSSATPICFTSSKEGARLRWNTGSRSRVPVSNMWSENYTVCGIPGYDYGRTILLTQISWLYTIIVIQNRIS